MGPSPRRGGGPGGNLPEAGAIKRLFAGISPRYDLLNRLLSLGMDRAWRRRTAAAVLDGLAPAGGAPRRILDLCSGTGDLAIELAHAGLEVTGADFCHEMLVIGREKAGRIRERDGRPRSAITMAEADALRLPFPDATFSGAAIAFGVRNLEDLDAGLREFHRVLKPGGRLAVLEFGRPRGAVIGALYSIYLNLAVPIVGRLVSGSREAYAWLSSSIQAFPDQAAFPDRLKRAGFTDVRAQSLTFGIAALYVGRKAAGISPEDWPDPAAPHRGTISPVIPPSASA